MSDTQQAPNAASDVEMSQYVADRQRVDEEKLKKDDEIIQQFGDYTYGWHDTDFAGEAAKKGIDENVVRAISASMNRSCVTSARTRASRSGCSTCVCADSRRSLRSRCPIGAWT